MSKSIGIKRSIFKFQDTNRYNAGRGAHLNLKRAERARVTVSKISGTDFFDYATACLNL
jgi:hypothetical protein